MKTNLTKHTWRMFCASILFVLAVSASAEEKPNVSNIGFMENPPKELKDKFPMCDAFLKVEWIDPENNVGYSEYEVYNQGKKIDRIAHALVYLDDDHPVFDVNLERDYKKGKLKETFDLIKQGEFEVPDEPRRFVLQLAAERNGQKFVYEFSDIRSDWNMPLLTLADHKLNVCISYPDNQKMYFAELKLSNKIFNRNEIESKKIELNKWIDKPFDMGGLTVLDVNFDGKEDYLTAIALIYSHSGRYQQLKLTGSKGSLVEKLTSPTNGKACEYRRLWAGPKYLTTDGNNILINNQCNLTELTK